MTPGGLACVAAAAGTGVAVTIAETIHVLPGVLRWANPPFRLPTAFVERGRSRHRERLGFSIRPSGGVRMLRGAEGRVTGLASAPGIFAGAATVIHALGAGHGAGQGIIEYLGPLPPGAPGATPTPVAFAS